MLPRDPMSRSTETTDASEPKKRKKKRKKAVVEPQVATEASEKEEAAPAKIPGAGTPDGTKLREALRAFEVGNYALVRERGRDLEKAEDVEVRKAALDLVDRTRVDPVQIVAILACVLVLVAILYVWVF
jgi:hypothetical protein